jgi:radical SAM superfamily enzyme YgiQ (UPF0313 family)
MKNKVLLVKLDKPAGGSQHLSFSEPIGLCYLSAVLKQAGIEVRLCHLIKESSENVLFEIIEEYQPTIVGFSLRNFNFNPSCRFIQLLKGKYPEIKVAIGGECITVSNGIKLLQISQADAAFINDSEESFVAWINGKDPDCIPGLVFRVEREDYRISKVKYQCVNPATLPMMDREGLPTSDYNAEAFPGKRYATMHTQRGCRYRCTFCHTAHRYKEPLSRTTEQILEEIDFLTARLEIEALAIWDEDFFSDPLRVRQIAQGLIDLGSPIQWHTYMKLTDLKNPDIRSLLPLLRKSGYVRAVIGLESFIPSTLKFFHKAGGPNIEESLQLLTDNNIKLCPSYIIGEPHETSSDIGYGLNHLMRLVDRGIIMDLPYISFLTPFPGTPLHDEYLEKGLIIDDNWDHYDGEHVIVKSKCSPETLIEMRDDFFRAFYENK